MYTVLTLILAGALPILATAQVDMTYITGSLAVIYGLFTSLVPLLVAIALLFFVWGVVLFIKDSGSEEVKVKAKSRIVWGLIGLFVIVSVWGLVALLVQLTGVNTAATVAPPQATF